MKQKFEYIWLDGNEEEPALRSKTKIISVENTFGKWNGGIPMLESVPKWSFDGSSTMQAEGKNSDCVLNPVKIIKDPTRKREKYLGFLVMCEVLNPDETPHLSNTRKDIEEYEKGDLWFGFEQEYVFIDPETQKPLGFPKQGYPNPQGQYYCGVGNINVKSRDIVEDHLNLCLDADLKITGINGEVMIGQWEYQIFSKGSKNAADDLWLSRFLLQRLGEKYGVNVAFHPKPVMGDWNGSGMHTNFSSKKMREVGISDTIFKIFKERHLNDIKFYGAYNDLRLTGLHETQNIETFSYGISDRGASIRIPISTNQNDMKGYLEDRRPASNADPYNVVCVITQNVLASERKLENEYWGK